MDCVCIKIDTQSINSLRTSQNPHPLYLSDCLPKDAGNPCDIFLPGAEYYDSYCFLPVSQKLSFQDAMVREMSILIISSMYYHFGISHFFLVFEIISIFFLISLFQMTYSMLSNTYCKKTIGAFFNLISDRLVT